MIKAKVISITYSESIDGIPKLDLETYLEDPVVPELFCGADFWNERDVIIMIKEDYESLRKRLNEKEGEICKLIVNNDVEQGRLREKIKKLEEENKGMESVIFFARICLTRGREKTRKLREENDKLKRENNDKEGDICKLIVNNDVEQARLREKIKKLEEENKALDLASDTLRNSLLDEREKTRKLREENEAIQKDIKDLEEKLAQEAGEVDVHPDGTMIFKTKRVSELEKKVKNLEEENKDLKKKVERLKEELFFFYKGLKYNERVSELEKEVEELNKSKSDIWLELNTVNAENEKLEEENKALKEDKFTMKITGGLFYQKED